jgi:hypothetical protein
VLDLALKKRATKFQTVDLSEAVEAAINRRCFNNVRKLLTFMGTVPSHLLESAIRSRDLSSIKLFVEEFKTPVNNPELFLSPLHMAVENGFLECAQLFIKNGANMNDISDNGVSVVMSAARNQHPACLSLLVENGVALNIKQEDIKQEKNDDDEDQQVDLSKPLFHETVWIISGVFERGVSYYWRLLEANGAKVVKQATKQLTHVRQLQ